MSAATEKTGCFIEAVVTEAGKPPRYLVRVIRSGTSKNNISYPPAVLREAVPLFDGVRVFAKSDAEHVQGGGKDFRQLVGKLSAPRFVESAGAGEIHAVLDVLESAAIATQLREAVTRDMTDLFGLSIDAVGNSKPVGRLREAKSITAVKSVDLIVEPGAGGQVIRFVEASAAGQPATTVTPTTTDTYKEANAMLRSQMIDHIRAANPARADALAKASDDQVMAAFREAVQHSPTGAGGDGAGPVISPAGSATVSAVTPEQMDERIRMVEARAEARVRIASSSLPELAKQKLQTRFIESANFKLADVDAAINAEADYVSSLREAAPISGLGGVSVVAGKSRSEAIQEGLDGLFAGKREGFRGFREAYIEITGDVEVSGRFANCDQSRLREAAGSHFREAVSAATFGDILGDSITRAMLRDYAADTRYSDWRELCDVVPVRDFRTQERTRMGGYGNLPAVAENAAYAALTTPGDEAASYALTKRGGTETISLEAIANDDVGLLRRIPQTLARSAARTLYEFVLEFMNGNGNIYDGTALFVAGHNNLGTAALDATSFAAARLRMRKQTELTSAKRLGLTLRHLYVPADLEQTAVDLFKRDTNNDETFVQSQKPLVHVVPHWTDANNWYATADKRDVPLIELGFYNGNELPELFVQDSPTQGSLFSNDQVKYKIRHIYSGAVCDFRGFDGSIVA